MRSLMKSWFEEIGHWLKHSNRFYHYLFSYILIVVVLLFIISSVVYGSFISVIQKEAERSTTIQLQQIKELVDTRVREMDLTALQITLNPTLTPFMISQDGYGMYSAVGELQKYRSSNGFIQDVAIYYEGSDPQLLYASSGTYELQNYVTSADISSLNQGMSKHLDDRGRLFYVHPLPEKYGVILFMIKEQELREMIRSSLNEYNGFIFILDKKGMPVVNVSNLGSEVKTAEVFEAVKQVNQEAAIDTVSVEGKPYSVMPIASEITGWSYIAVLDQEQLLGKVNETRTLFNFTVAAVLLIGLVMAVVFSIRNYRPIRRLASIVNEGRILETTSKRDELKVISEAFGEIAKENESLSVKLKSQSGLLKERYILALLDGKLDGHRIPDTLGFATLRFDKPHYAVLLLLIDDFEAFTRHHPSSMQDIIKYSLVKMLEDLADEVGRGYGVEFLQRRGVALVLNMEAGHEEPLKPLISLAEKAASLSRQYYNLTVTVGVGGVHDDIAMIHKSFAQADYALRHKLVKGAGKVIAYHEIKQSKENTIWYPLDMEKQLVIAIKQGNSEEVESLLRNMMGSIAAKPLSIEQVEYICFDMINTVIKTTVEMNIPLDDADLTVEQMFASRFETFSELERLMIDYCQQICKYIESQKESKNRDLLEQLRIYVLEHYTDPSIGLESIADEFGFSASYLTRYFKNQTGQSLKHYIDQIRMEKAKELLIHSDMTLGDIVQRVGYVDSTNFIRKFKKLEGITPIQYRTIVQTGPLPISK